MSEGMAQGQDPQQPAVTIRAKNNGPFLVEGPFRLIDADGNEYELEAGKKYNLCRCGGSTKKPFCDGAHSRIGFEAAERAVRAADAQAEGGAPA
ncbi:MAG TPA: CDGSH iron-sulfur domain-containing protein [Longimicrobium sp.]|uniref:CDGSH iron-sulfur domain-containing protein n=1 Tax=Longimicrobium sp. TaxID=2029185 RepID=UPI002EDB0A45